MYQSGCEKPELVHFAFISYHQLAEYACKRGEKPRLVHLYLFVICNLFVEGFFQLLHR